MRCAMRFEQVDEPLLLSSNVASGPRTALDNPRATARRLERGDLVLVDLYPLLDGYVADLTRSFVVGTPTALQRERHAALEAALGAAEACLRPGASVSGIDDAIRAALRAAGGYETTMGHHSGHGIGLLAWEEPDRLHRGLQGAAFTATALSAVRRRGWAQSVGEREPGVASVSAPVRSPSGRVIAAVSISGPIERLSRQPGRLHAATVMAGANKLTEVLARHAAQQDAQNNA